ncbi:MAG: PLP-dependent aminotransferase family protein, partial [Salinibacterium sp.]|nr:PLP-dependent aminotransferase family protein [Salinibacterium sp.]
MVQAILHDLLTDPASVRHVETARSTYASRQAEFATAMFTAGIPVVRGDGINAWLPVNDERNALVRLAANGIRVAPGGPFQLGGGQPHVRVSVGMAASDTASIADALAEAARA